ncbi:MAG: hypothetical protein CVV61_00510 [Tenericutes bacterium HGW-Tenericutes-6]|jgi:competence transcription factor ComK|nr:MAG: hypothetical protein CVV61_00510 [Tenericutes bacterium HGW-Tenericutes-6]
MILYLKQTNLGTEIYQKTQKMITSKSPLSVIKALCIAHLCTYEGYIKSVQSLFHIKQLIPVYLSDDLMLIPTGRVRDYLTIWVNVSEVIDIKPLEHKTMLTFSNQENLVILMSLRKYLRAKHVLEKIRNTKVKHFHLQ